MSRRGTPVYAAFDLLALDGQDLRALPLLERKRRLRRLIRQDGPALRYVPHVRRDGVDFFHAACALDLDAAPLELRDGGEDVELEPARRLDASRRSADNLPHQRWLALQIRLRNRREDEYAEVFPVCDCHVELMVHRSTNCRICRIGRWRTADKSFDRRLFGRVHRQQRRPSVDRAESICC
jgi:hypothetical protein